MATHRLLDVVMDVASSIIHLETLNTYMHTLLLEIRSPFYKKKCAVLCLNVSKTNTKNNTDLPWS